MTTSSALAETHAPGARVSGGGRGAGVALSAHVRSRRLDLRKIYDAIAQLRRRGICRRRRAA